MAKNSSLITARDAKNDEFYTRYEDIQVEINHYEKHFKEKTVFCNCDDPYESSFCKFFLRNFNYLGLKRLICTSYVSSPVVGSQLTIFDLCGEEVKRGRGYVMDITEVPMANGRGVSDDDIDRLLKSKKRGVKKLEGNGDFRSEECIEYLKQADIVVTNPPFSLFREYIALLMKYEKLFLIVGNQNNISYKEVFPLIQNNMVWLGNTSPKEFIVPKEQKDRKNTYVRDDGKIIAKFGNTCWFTNLDIKKRHEEIILYKKYNPDDYPKYVNYDAIDVSSVSNIPCDYYGIMGVPITFLDRYNPDQFEILGFSLELASPMKNIAPKGSYMTGGKRFYTKNLTQKDEENGFLYHREYDRIAIRRKEHN